jgi:hypothetical protein
MTRPGMPCSGVIELRQQSSHVVIVDAKIDAKAMQK